VVWSADDRRWKGDLVRAEQFIRRGDVARPNLWIAFTRVPHGRRVAKALKKNKEELIGRLDRDVVPRRQADKFREMDQSPFEGHTHALGGIAIEVKEK
jgi:hypothetical protein